MKTDRAWRSEKVRQRMEEVGKSLEEVGLEDRRSREKTVNARI